MSDVETPGAQTEASADTPPASEGVAHLAETADLAPPPQRSHKKSDPWILRFLGSYAVAVVVLLLLALLTFFGTLEQRTDNIYNVVNKYFKSLFVVVQVGPIPLPLLGAYPLLAILGVNLLVGGFLRLRYSWSRAGIFITHLGMVVLLVGALVEERTSIGGKLSFIAAEPLQDLNGNGQWDPGERFADLDENGKWTPGETVDEYESYTDWDLVVCANQSDGSVREYVIPFAKLAAVGQRGQRVFTHEELPFDVGVRSFADNARVVPVQGGASYGVDGLALQPLPESVKQKEASFPGMYVTLRDPGAGFKHEAIVWAGQRFPHRVSMGERTFDLDLRLTRWKLPFALRLNEVIHEKYPRSGIAMEYSSRVTKIENDLPEDRHITMNAPLRHKKLTFYQSEVHQLKTGQQVSVLATVYNPADGYGAWAAVVVAIGLLWHFGRKLYYHIRTERRRRTA